LILKYQLKLHFTTIWTMPSKQSFPRKPRTRPAKLNEDALWDLALKQLSRRAQSANQLRAKLSLRADSPAAVTAVMQKLREYGYTDDQKFSEAFASSRLQNEGFGRYRVLRDLQSKRVSSGVAQEAVSKIFEGADEKDLIDAYLARKYRSLVLHDFLQLDKNVASAYRRLRTAGFSSSATLAALKRHSQRAADWEEPPESD
jgi:regulatory protein